MFRGAGTHGESGKWNMDLRTVTMDGGTRAVVSRRQAADLEGTAAHGFAAELERTVQTAGTETAPEPGTALKKASEQDVAELAAAFDPLHMTQEEYDAFLEELAERGILSEDDLGQLGYHGMYVVGTLDLVGSGGIVASILASNSSDPIGWCAQPGLTQTNGNALAMARIMASWEPVSAGSEELLAFARRGFAACTVMAEVLTRMDAKRNGAGAPDLRAYTLRRQMEETLKKAEAGEVRLPEIRDWQVWTAVN